MSRHSHLFLLLVRHCWVGAAAAQQWPHYKPFPTAGMAIGSHINCSGRCSWTLST